MSEEHISLSSLRLSPADCPSMDSSFLPQWPSSPWEQWILRPLCIEALSVTLDLPYFLSDLLHYSSNNCCGRQSDGRLRTFPHFITQRHWVQLRNSLLNRAPKSKQVKEKQWHTVCTGYIPMNNLTRRFRQPVKVIRLASINYIQQLVN